MKYTITFAAMFLYVLISISVDIGEPRPAYTIDVWTALMTFPAMLTPFVLGYLAGKERR